MAFVHPACFHSYFVGFLYMTLAMSFTMYEDEGHGWRHFRCGIRLCNACFTLHSLSVSGGMLKNTFSSKANLAARSVLKALFVSFAA